MVLDREDHAKVLTIEANIQSVKRASKLLDSDPNYKSRFKVLQGYTTDEAVVGDILSTYSREPNFCDALLQEILGFIACGEGVAYVIADLKAKLGKQFQPFYIPRRVATFYTPTFIDTSHIFRKLRDLYVDPSMRTVLVRSLPFEEVHLHLDKPDSLECGCLEYIDFADFPPYSGRQDEGVQLRSKSFEIHRPTLINSLALFLWVGFSGSDTTTKSRSFNQTHYPYGVTDLPIHPKGYASFSSCSIDSAFASNWRNLVLVFPKAIEFNEGDSIEVETIANTMKLAEDGQPRPEYKIIVSKIQKGLRKRSQKTLPKIPVCISNLDELYPTYTTTF